MVTVLSYGGPADVWGLKTQPVRKVKDPKYGLRVKLLMKWKVKYGCEVKSKSGSYLRPFRDIIGKSLTERCSPTGL